jgi:hypothetical protein
MPLRILGTALNTLGAVILAWRVKGILDALVAAQHANDSNFRLLIEVLNGQQQSFPLLVGMSQQVERRQRRGIFLLVIGFGLIAVGNVLTGLSVYF